MISFDSSSCPNPISLFHHSSVEPGTLMLNKHQLPQLKDMCIQNDLFSGFTQHFVFQKGDSKTKMEQPGNASLKKGVMFLSFFLKVHIIWRCIKTSLMVTTPKDMLQLLMAIQSFSTSTSLLVGLIRKIQQFLRIVQNHSVNTLICLRWVGKKYLFPTWWLNCDFSW